MLLTASLVCHVPRTATVVSSLPSLLLCVLACGFVMLRGLHGRRTKQNKLVETLPEAHVLKNKVAALRETYASLSELYQDSKDRANGTQIPLS